MIRGRRSPFRQPFDPAFYLKFGVFMISFACSCGKKYQLPDRVGGREVRCNQCHKTLLVPKRSQDEPVVPMDDPESTEQAENMDAKPESVAPVSGEPSIRLDEISAAGTTGKSVMDEVDWGAAPVGKKPVETPLNPTPDAVSNPQADQSTPEGAKPDVSKPSVSKPSVSRADVSKPDVSQPKSSSGILLVLAITAILSLVLGFLGGKWIAGDRDAGSAATGAGNPDRGNSGVSRNSAAQAGDFAATDWKVVDQEPIPFIVKVVDSKAVRISLDGNPVDNAKKDKSAVLDNLAAALATDDENAENKGPRHRSSYKIESESPETLRLVWPGSGWADLDGTKLKEFRFFLYLSDQANSGFEPKKPEGVDQVLEFSDFRLRLIAETGYVDFVPADKEKLVLLAEPSRREWTSVRIPVNGDEVWKRENHGLVGPLVVEKIELHVKPTGKGLTFWLDNLQIDE